MQLGLIGFTEILLLVPIAALIFGPPLYFGSVVARKAGFSRAWTVAILIPFVNWIVIWAFAFVEWKRPASAENDAEM